MKKYLLDCEIDSNEKDQIVRRKLIKEFSVLPKEFLSKMRHFQPQVGCPNKCGFCSQFSGNKIESFTIDDLKNVICAIKYTAQKYVSNKPYLAWDRKEHRIGVIFPYLDNDIGNYELLDQFIKLCYDELGVKVRISTVTYSRHNALLQAVHNNIVNTNIIKGLAGVRISLAPFGLAWESNLNKYSIDEYQKDIVNFLNLYKKYYDLVGSGSRKFCIELRYKPLINLEPINVYNYNGYYVIRANDELFISDIKTEKLDISFVKDAMDHNLIFSNCGYKFRHYKHTKDIPIEIIKTMEFEVVDLYAFSNIDGIYYCINPKLNELGNYGYIIYPKTEKRTNSGILIIERFLLNAMAKIKLKYNLKLSDKFENATYSDVENVRKELIKCSNGYKTVGKEYISKYIIEEVVVLFDILVKALKESNYPASCIFDKDFTIDTGIICNLGRGINYFKKLVSKVNEPLTPIHERNYGKISSTMVKEGYAWRLSCYRNNTIIIQKLNLADTSDESGQVKYSKIIGNNMFNNNIQDCQYDTKFLVPGEKL